MKRIVLALCFLLIQCGFADAITDPEVVVYNASTSGPGAETSECEAILLRSYQQLLKESVDASCSSTSGCHGGGAGGLTLISGSDAANLQAFIDYTNTAAPNALLEKLNGTTGHVGGMQTGQNNLKNEDIQAWDLVESNCE